LVDQNIAAVRLFIRLRDARLPRRSCHAAKAGPRIRYKPWYETQQRQALHADLCSAPGVARESRADRGRFLDESEAAQTLPGACHSRYAAPLRWHARIVQGIGP
jgi:hypothetical protein